MDRCGFQGTDTFMIKVDNVVQPCNEKFANGHLAMTYTGLASLLILGDDLSRVNRTAIVHAVRSLQQEDGRYTILFLLYLWSIKKICQLIIYVALTNQ